MNIGGVILLFIAIIVVVSLVPSVLTAVDAIPTSAPTGVTAMADLLPIIGLATVVIGSLYYFSSRK